MKSYILAIAVAMFFSALYAFQNAGDVVVKLFMFEWVFPQGVWDVLVFAGGAVLMWLFSLFSGLETKSKYKKIIKEKDEKIAALEKEKTTLFESLGAARRSFEEPAAPVVVQEEPQSAETAD